jgi:hypothetical protein
MALTSDNRVSPIAWLIGCVVIGVLCYWYPLVLANSFDRDVHSRIGVIGVLTIPVLLVSSVRAILGVCSIDQGDCDDTTAGKRCLSDSRCRFTGGQPFAVGQLDGIDDLGSHTVTLLLMVTNSLSEIMPRLHQ